MKKGFTIIELMAVILIISIGVLGSYSVVRDIFASTNLISTSLPAVYLAQEGVEIVRNIRDSNWVADNNWDDGLSLGSWQADYDDQSLSAYNGSKLKLNNHRYNYAIGSDSLYDRKITIGNGPDSNSLNISVTVNWSILGTSHNVIVQENIYEWK